MKKILLCILFLICFVKGNSQTTKIDSLLLIEKQEFNTIKLSLIRLELAKEFEKINLVTSKKYAHKVIISPTNDSILAESKIQIGRIHFFSNELDSAIYYFEGAKKYFKEKLDKQKTSQINISIGAVNLRKGKYNKTIKIFTDCATYFETIDDKLNLAKCYSNIATALAELDKYNESIDYSLKALALFSNLNLPQFELITLPNLAAQHLKNGDTIRAIFYNEEAEKKAIKLNNKRSLSIIYNNLGSIYLDKNNLKSINYLKKSLKIKNELHLNNGIEAIESNLAYLSIKNKKFNEAISYYKSVEKKVNGNRLCFVYNQLSFCYKKLYDYNNALIYSEAYAKLKDSILEVNNLKTFNEIKIKYEAEKKEKEILNLQTENLKITLQKNQNKYFAIALIVTLFILALTAFFYFKNTQKKKLIAQQKNRIKTQDFEKKIKSLELQSIENIINTQEKERTRIANDLHDNLGSKISILKLQFEHLKNIIPSNSFEKGYHKITTLVDDIYNEVRKIAHNKNFGNLIQEGLVNTTINFAKSLTVTKELNIEVININSSVKLKNNIEIQLFRIIQELLTNIIKHSNATEVVIQFSQNNNLTIMVEDNGIGFDPASKKFGFGLNNIQARINSLNGNLNIDSSLNNGTTIIISIPLT